MRHALIADDDGLLRDTVADCLDDLGWRCQAVSSGQAAIAVLAHERMDLLVSDIDMPDMTGFALLDWLGAHPPAPRVILMSARADAQLARSATAAGAIALLAKPFPADRLRGLVAASFT